MLTTQLTGIVRGHTIELEGESGLPNGQRVAVQIQPVPARLPPGEGLRRAFGAWADDVAGLDQFLESNRVNRKRSRREVET